MTYATQHNGGKLQAGLNYLQGGGFWPFLNNLKIVQNWGWISGSAPMSPDLFNSDGYPLASSTMTAAGGVTMGGLTLPSPTARPGNYVTSWDGNGTTSVAGAPCTLQIASATAANPCVLTLSSINDINTGVGQPGNNPAKFVVNQQIVIAGVTGTNAGSLNTRQTVTAVSTDGLQVTLSLNMASTSFNAANATASHSEISTAGFGRCVYYDTNWNGASGFTIRSTGSPIITNAKLYHYNDEAAILAGDIFGDQFMRRMRAGNFGVVRVMNDIGATDVGGTIVGKWADANKPESYYCYQGGQMKTAIYCGVTTGTNCNYVAAAPTQWATSAGGTLPAEGQLVHVAWHGDSPGRNRVTDDGANSVNWTAHNLPVGAQVIFTGPSDSPPGTSGSGNTQPFIVDNVYDGVAFQHVYYVLAAGLTANKFKVCASPPPATTVATLSALDANCRSLPTLAVAGTNPLYLLNLSGGPMSGDLGEPNYPAPSYGQGFSTLLFDPLLNGWIKGGMIDNGAPASIWIRLGAELGAHIWFTTHKNSLLSSSRDLVTGLATYCRDNAPSWLIPRFEGPNENFATNNRGYSQAVADAYSRIHGTAWDNNDVYSKMISLMGQDVAAVYGISQANVITQRKYRIECGVQTVMGNQMTPWNDVLNSTRYVTDQGGSPAKNWVTHVNAANYTYPPMYGRLEEIALAWQYWVTHGGNAKQLPTGALLTDATTFENQNYLDLAPYITYGIGTNQIATSIPHNLYAGQPVLFSSCVAFPGFGGDRLYVHSVVDATHFRICQGDPYDTLSTNRPGGSGGFVAPSAYTFSGSQPAAGKTVVIPGGGGNMAQWNIVGQNISLWAKSFNAGIDLDFYEGGYSPDYMPVAASPVFAWLTAAANTTNCVFTVPIIDVNHWQGHSPPQHPIANYNPIQNGMRMRILGAVAPDDGLLDFTAVSGLGGGWGAAFVANPLLVVSGTPSGTSINTTFNASGCTGNLSTVLASAGIKALRGDLEDSTGISVVTMQNTLRWAGKYSSTLQANTTTHYNQLAAITPNGFPAMYYLSVGVGDFDANTPPSHGPPSKAVWAVLEDVYMSPDPALWLAAVAFNAGGGVVTPPAWVTKLRYVKKH